MVLRRPRPVAGMTALGGRQKSPPRCAAALDDPDTPFRATPRLGGSLALAKGRGLHPEATRPSVRGREPFLGAGPGPVDPALQRQQGSGIKINRLANMIDFDDPPHSLPAL